MDKRKAEKKAAQPKRTANKPAPESVDRESSSTEFEPQLTAGKAGQQFPIVGIGASAGGLEAFNELLAAMPVDTGMAFVIVTHLHPTHPSMLPELLRKVTKMPVIEAADGIQVQPDHVYVEPPGGHLAILGGGLQRMETEKTTSPHLPIDYFFRSLAEDQAGRAVGVVLSGTGSDGTQGVTAIKNQGGMVMVQQPTSAKYPGMPSSAIATGRVDYVLSASEMPSQLASHANEPANRDREASRAAVLVAPEPLQKMFVLIRARTGHDFSSYKTNTVRRRIERRMNVHRIRDGNQYVQYLQENPHEIDSLFKELLINVTAFFRDPAAFESLAKGALTDLCASRPDDYTFRAWVPGCATGEEVFSLAIILREINERSKRRCGIQIFGTDLDSNAIEKARIGEYPESIAENVTASRLQRFFEHKDHGYLIRKEIREMAVFATQNVIKDPPFTKLDLLSCRNLMIYLNADLQKRLLPIFHYALKPGGLLFLGTSESLGGFGELFETVDKRWKIFRRKETPVVGYALPEMPTDVKPAQLPGTRDTSMAPPLPNTQISTLIERKLLADLCPASIVVNERGDIVHVQGRTGKYMELADGQARTNILDMARKGLSNELSAAIREASLTEQISTREDIRFKSNGGFKHVDVAVQKILDPEPIRGLLIVTFHDSPDSAKSQQPASGAFTPTTPRSKRKLKGSEERIAELEKQLVSVNESHQTTLEELRSSNEELKSSNEEAQSTNEELQSINEELETSKEEMQSLNEELTTVNSELQSNVDELSQANNDMQNLLNSTNVATVFLDTNMHVKRYTEQATEVVKLRPVDLGRPISELATNLRYDGLLDDCHTVLRTLVPKECEVQSKDGTWYLMQVMPYRTLENVIDGVVVTLVTIDRLKAAEAKAAAGKLFENIFDTIREPLVMLDKELAIVSCNRSFYERFQTRPQQVKGKRIDQLEGTAWDQPQLRTLLERVLPEKDVMENFQITAEFDRIGKRTFLLNARRLIQNSGSDLILLAMEEQLVE